MISNGGKQRRDCQRVVLWLLCLCPSACLAFSTSFAPSRRIGVTIIKSPHQLANGGIPKRHNLRFPELNPPANAAPPAKTQQSALFLKRNHSFENPSRQTKLKHVFAQWKARLVSALKFWKRKAAIGLFCLMMVFSVASGDALAKGTMGRSGGSFKSAPSRVPSSRSYSPPSRSHYYRPSPRPPSHLYYRNPRPIIHVGPTYQPYGPQMPLMRRGFRASDLILVTGSGLAIAYGVSTALEKERSQKSSALGPGFTVAKLTVAMSVPDRDAPNSILRKLQNLSSMAQTNTRKGVQDLLSSVALELLRQEQNIRSAASTTAHYKHEGEVERDYLRQSIQERSKFDDEKEYKFGRNEKAQEAKKEDTNATEAVVTILVAIEGDSTRLRPIKSRNDVLDALNRIAVDAQVDDCLLSGEISWAPELRSESLAVDDIYVDYPMLFPV